MSLPNPSPMDRHILDLLDRIERAQMERLASLEERMRTLEARNDELEAQLRSQESGIISLSDSLAAYLALPASPRA
ncbi:hypothetical protein [Paracoccus chinensis]|uniref:SlyX protein n=1 Tax=Paracoccus chinensis TaxID=525640 RepID=A0A1G9MNT8_9RHOB|nr:hypothetical protein [Paracoccus chinensis]SDL75753.1 hypothetical protein SAMN04487971_12223 [Paracoccus chinensis]